MAKYATLNNLQRFWDGLKTKFVAQEEGKGLSTNDFTDELKTKYDNAEANKIEVIKVNGLAAEISDDDKSVDISVITKASELDNDAGFVTSESVYDKEAIDGKVTTLNEAIAAAAAGNIAISIVDAIPDVESASEKVIYFVPRSEAEDDNVYNEYMLINGSMELLGTTEVDLSGYLKETDVEEITDEEVDAIFTTE